MADPETDAIPNDEGEIFDVNGAGKPPPKRSREAPAYRVYEGSRIAVSKSMGKMWSVRRDAAKATYDAFYNAWDQAFSYYNFYHADTRRLLTPLGEFRRGDGSENVVYSNLNAMLPAVYGKNPDITCSTVDEEDKEFCRTMEEVLKALLRRQDKCNAKPKIKRATAMALLTNSGILKLDYQLKADSREEAVEQMAMLTEKLRKTKNTKETEEIYGQIAALEATMEISKASGADLSVLLPHSLLVDPYAEMPDGTDANWMMESVLISTEYLKAKFTQKDKDGRDVLVYKATHKANLNTSEREDGGLSRVYDAMAAPADVPTAHTEEERADYLYSYMTACVYVWDKTTRRTMLFLEDDWSWPIWVWDDQLNLSRFFPYFLFGFGFSTGGTITVGETSYYLDHQDEVNDINRQVARIRRSIFDYFYYNSRKVNREQIEPLIDAIRGVGSADQHAVGVDLPEGMKWEEVFGAILPPSADYEQLFNKEAVLSSINRLTNTSDAFRGVQFKTNTNEKAVETYQDQVRLATGAKVDVIEDSTADIAHALAELAVQFMDKTDVEGLVGAKFAEAWRNMSVVQFNSTYSLEIVAGSTEKPTSVFKQKQAVNVAQAVGQFAQGAPGASLLIMLKMLRNAFPAIIISDEDWEMLTKEVTANLSQSQGAGQEGQSPAGANGQAGQSAEVEELLQKAPPQVKQRIAAAAQQGATPEQIRAMLEQAAGAANPEGQSNAPRTQ